MHSVKEGVGFAERGTVIVKAMSVGSDLEPVPLVDLVERISKCLAEIEPEYRSTARLNIRAYEGAAAFVDVTYLRPETDEEFATRQTWIRNLDEAKMKTELLELDRLKTKYGG